MANNFLKQAQKNEKLQQQGKLTTNNFYVNTNGMSYKDFKKAMKQNGWQADSKEARGFFYEQLNPEPEETIQKVKNPYIVGLGETLLPIAPVTPTGVEKVIVKKTSTKPVINPVKTVVNPVKVTKKVNQPEQVVEVKKVVVPANPVSLDPTYYDTNENQGISIDWNKMNEEFGGLSPEQVQNLLNYQQFLKNHSHKHYMFPASWGAYKTHYFQKGGSVKKSSSQQDAVMQFVNALAQTLQADPQQVIQAAQQNPEALKSAVQVYQETQGDIQKAAQAFSQALQSQAQVARHGAKLNYIKSLKNQCAEDEELYYYKKGGSVGCGCKKKEQGGEMEKDKKDSSVKRFKMARGGQTPEKKSTVNPSDTVMVKGKPYSLVNTDGSRITKLYPAYVGKVEEEDRKKAKAGDKDAQKRQEKRDIMEADKCGGKMKKEACGGVAKFKADKCGGKMKKK